MPSTIDLAERFANIISLQQQILAAATDPDRVMKLVVDKTPGVTSGAGAVIERVEGEELVYAAASGPAASFVGTRLPVAGSLSGLAARERTLLRSDNTEIDPRVDAAACHSIGIRSMVIAPLLEGDVVTGVLKTFSPRANRFNDLDAHALQLVAGMTASALMLARQYRQREISEERYRMLFEQNVAGVFRTTLTGEILDCNRALAESLGYGSREELLSRQSWDLYPQRADREGFLETLQRERAMRNFRLSLKRKDGSVMAGVVNVSLIPAEGGESQLLGTLVAE
ncbi:MAG TPA: PAS domain S-box protein [Thermoanaerobaculia bacterium]|nr:PAS domain S-box protein [Thermoanaerobaculia bacterium]